MSRDDGDLGDRRALRPLHRHPSHPIPVIPICRRLQLLLPFLITRSADQPITGFLSFYTSPCLRGRCSVLPLRAHPSAPQLSSQIIPSHPDSIRPLPPAIIAPDPTHPN